MFSGRIGLLWLAMATSTLAQSSEAEEDLVNTIIAAHGWIMAIAFTILFPIGAIIIRMLRFKGVLWFHVAIQTFAYLTALAGFGLGAWVATTSQEWYGPLSSGSNNGHPIIGTLVVGILLLQPIGGMLHHIESKEKHRRTFWSYVHIWTGRIILTLGIINGGLGIQLSGGPSWAIPAYSVVAVVFWLLWVGAAVYGEMRGEKKPSSELDTKDY